MLENEEKLATRLLAKPRIYLVQNEISTGARNMVRLLRRRTVNQPVGFSVVCVAMLSVTLAGCGASLDLLGPAEPGGIKTGSIEKAAPKTGAKTYPSANAAILAARAKRRNQGPEAAYELLKDAETAFANDPGVIRELGLLALETGRPRDAEWRLRTAIARSKADWKTYSALGSSLAAQDRHVEARAAFSTALKMAPDNLAVINNLAMSHVMAGDLAKAENLLRGAERYAGARGQSSQIRQNLALVVGLRGRVNEARDIGKTAWPSARAEDNVAVL